MRILLTLLLFVSVAQAQPAAPQAAERLAVAPFADRRPQPAPWRFDEEAFAGALTRALKAEGVGTVDRALLVQQLRERELAAAGLLEPGLAAPLGRSLEADHVLMGEVTAYEARITWRPLPFSKERKEQQVVVARCQATVRLVDGKTSQIVFAGESQAEWRRTKMFPNRFEGASLPDDLPARLLRGLAEAVVRDVLARLRPITIQSIKSGVHVLTRRGGLALKTGQELEVFGPGPSGHRLGRLRVTAVEGGQAKAKLVEGGPLLPGSECRLPKEVPAKADPTARRKPAGW